MVQNRKYVESFDLGTERELNEIEGKFTSIKRLYLDQTLVSSHRSRTWSDERENVANVLLSQQVPTHFEQAEKKKKTKNKRQRIFLGTICKTLKIALYFLFLSSNYLFLIVQLS